MPSSFAQFWLRLMFFVHWFFLLLFCLYLSFLSIFPVVFLSSFHSLCLFLLKIHSIISLRFLASLFMRLNYPRPSAAAIDSLSTDFATAAVYDAYWWFWYFSLSIASSDKDYTEKSEILCYQKIKNQCDPHTQLLFNSSSDNANKNPFITTDD